MPEQTIAPVKAKAPSSEKRRIAPLLVGTIASVFAVVLLAGGGWALWKDRVDRDASGFVSIGTASLRTDACDRRRLARRRADVVEVGRARRLPSSRHVGRAGAAVHRDRARRPLPLSRRRRLRDDRQLRGHGRHHPCGWTTVGSALTGVDLGDIDARWRQRLRWDSRRATGASCS